MLHSQISNMSKMSEFVFSLQTGEKLKTLLAETMLIIYILEAKQLIVFQFFFFTNFVLLLPNAYLVDDALIMHCIINRLRSAITTD